MQGRVLLLGSLWLSFATTVLADSKPLETIAEFPLHSASATALSMNAITLSAQLQATVKTIHVQVSQRVKNGEALVSLDCADYELALQLAEARVRAAQARTTLADSQRKRNEQLVTRQLTSQETADTAVTEAISRKADLDEARVGQRQAALDISRCVIKAPFDGIVTARNIGEGQLASVASPLVTMVETARMELSARLDPSDVPLLQQSRELAFEAGDQRYPVRIAQLGGVIDSTTRNQEIRFTFSAAKPPPGSAGKLLWRDPRPFIPAEYIVMRDQRHGVFIDRDGVAEFSALKSPTPGRASPVDLPLQTLIVTSGLGSLKSGDSLTNSAANKTTKSAAAN